MTRRLSSAPILASDSTEANEGCLTPVSIPAMSEKDLGACLPQSFRVQASATMSLDVHFFPFDVPCSNPTK